MKGKFTKSCGKKILAFVLAFLMVPTLLPIDVFAQAAVQNGTYYQSPNAGDYGSPGAGDYDSPSAEDYVTRGTIWTDPDVSSSSWIYIYDYDRKGVQYALTTSEDEKRILRVMDSNRDVQMAVCDLEHNILAIGVNTLSYHYVADKTYYIIFNYVDGGNGSFEVETESLCESGLRFDPGVTSYNETIKTEPNEQVTLTVPQVLSDNPDDVYEYHWIVGGNDYPWTDLETDEETITSMPVDRPLIYECRVTIVSGESGDEDAEEEVIEARFDVSVENHLQLVDETQSNTTKSVYLYPGTETVLQAPEVTCDQGSVQYTWYKDELVEDEDGDSYPTEVKVGVEDSYTVEAKNEESSECEIVRLEIMDEFHNELHFWYDVYTQKYIAFADGYSWNGESSYEQSLYYDMGTMAILEAPEVSSNIPGIEQKLNYQWYKQDTSTNNRVMLEGETNSKLIVKVDDRYEIYWCEVTTSEPMDDTITNRFNDAKLEAEYDITGRATESITFTNGNSYAYSNVAVKPKGSVTLKTQAVKFAYPDTLTYQWYVVDNASNFQVTLLKGENGSTLKLDNVEKNRQYMCSITSPYSTNAVNESFMVNVDNEFYLKGTRDQSRSVVKSVDKGSKVTLKVPEVQGIDIEDLTYRWYDYKTYQQLGDGKTYVITDCQKNQNIVCAVSDKFGNNVREFTDVTINNDLQFSYTDSQKNDKNQECYKQRYYRRISIKPGKSLKLSLPKITANDTSDMTYQWGYSNQGMADLVDCSGNVYDLGTNVKSGLYYAYVNDKYGNELIADYTVNVENNLRYTEDASTKMIKVSPEGTTTLHASKATADSGKLHYAWYSTSAAYYDGSQMLQDKQPRYNVTPIMNPTLATETDSLEINNSTTAAYACVISDDYGNEIVQYFDVSQKDSVGFSDTDSRVKVNATQYAGTTDKTVTLKSNAVKRDGQNSYAWYKYSTYNYDNKDYYSNYMSITGNEDTCQVTVEANKNQLFACVSTDSSGYSVIDLYEFRIPSTQYSVTYAANGGDGATVPQAQFVKKNGTITITSDKPTRTGYTFSSWNTKKDGSGTKYLAGDKIKMTKNVVLYARWSANKYTVSYDANGGKGTMDAQTLTYNKETTLTKNAFSRTGYKFVGWNTASDGTGTSYKDAESVKNMTSQAKGKVTLYAQWKANTYNVVFDGNGSTSGSMTKQAFTYNKSQKLTANAFERTGYVFTGWNTATDGSGKTYADQASVKNLKSRGTCTLYAQWKPNVYTVTFDGNGSKSGSVADQKFTYNKSQALTANAFKKTGYTFSSWNTAADGSGKTYKNKASVKNLTSEVNGKVTLYARWSANKYKVVFEAHGGKGTMDAQTFTYNKSQNLTPNAFSRTGYTFVGWNTKTDGSGKSYENAASVKNLTSRANGTVTLYAVWKANTYRVSFDGNGSTSGSMDAQNFTYNKSQALTSNAFKKSGYTFTGWNTKADGSGKAYANAGSVKNLTSKANGTVKLYAQWKANAYKVAFYANDNSATGSMSKQSFTYDKSQKLTSNAFKKSGYTFIGWNTKADGTGKSYGNKATVNNLTTKSNGTVKLYAQWAKSSYKVKYSKNNPQLEDGSKVEVSGSMSTQSMKYSSSTALRKNTFACDGYEFTGWNTKADGSGVTYTDQQKVKIVTKGTITLYAQWNKINSDQEETLE